MEDNIQNTSKNSIELISRPIVFLLLAFVLLGLYYSFETPLFEGPDEISHYQYVAYLAGGHGLPIQVPIKPLIYEGHQPPLYYAVCALLTFGIKTDNFQLIYRPNPAFIWMGLGQEPNLLLHTAAEYASLVGVVLLMHIARLVSILFGAITVWATYQLGRRIARSEIIAVGAAAVVAFNPQFLFINSVVNNDSAVIAFSTLALLMMALILIEGSTRQRLIWLGIWISLAILSKLSGLILIPLAAFVVAIVSLREQSWRTLIKLAATLSLPLVVLSGWWFIRNQMLYGDPLAYKIFLSLHSPLTPLDFSASQTWQLYTVVMHRSFWGQFGWMVIYLSDIIYILLAASYALAIVGAIIVTVKHFWHRAAFQIGWIFLIVVVITMIIWSLNQAHILGGYALQGRYLFPVISVITILIVGGISVTFPSRIRAIAITGIVGCLAVLSFIVPSQYIAPVYRFFTVPESTLQEITHHLNGTFSAEIALAGYDRQSNDDSLRLTLYWRAQGTPKMNYKVFIHAVNENSELCGQQDGLPLDGAFLMTSWRAGDVIKDVHIIPFDSACCAGGTCKMDVGLYREDTGIRLLYSVDGEPVSDHVEINP